LKEDQQNLVFSLLDNEDYNQHSNDEIAKIKFIEESHNNGMKPENIVTVEIKAPQNDTDQEDVKAYVRDQLQQNRRRLGIQNLLKSKLEVVRNETIFLKSMVDHLRNSSTAKELFLFFQSPKEVYQEINNKAALLGLENMIVDSADYDKLQVTNTLNSQGINFTFEVPCMKPNTMTTLYSYKPLPIVINKNLTNDVQAALYIESRDANVIAIGQDNTSFMVLNQDELHFSL
jgi:hypothetical protein